MNNEIMSTVRKKYETLSFLNLFFHTHSLLRILFTIGVIISYHDS